MPGSERQRLLWMCGFAYLALASCVGYWALWRMSRVLGEPVDSLSDVCFLIGIFSSVSILALRAGGKGRTGQAVALLPFGGELRESDVASGPGRCSLGCAHPRWQLWHALRLAPIAAWKRDFNFYWLVASSGAMLVFLYARAVRIAEPRWPFLLQPSGSSAGFFGISLGFCNLFGHDFTGVEVVYSVGLVGCCFVAFASAAITAPEDP